MAKLRRILLKGLRGGEKLDLVSKYARILIELGKRDPEIRELAVRIVSSCRGKDYRCEAETLHRWVQDNIRYARDPLGVERFATANRTLQERAGDCDDSSITLSALLESIGHETRLIFIDGDLSGKFTHVIAQAKIRDTWYWMETTKKVPFGWAPKFTISHIIDQNSVGEEDMGKLDDVFGTDVGDLGGRGGGGGGGRGGGGGSRGGGSRGGGGSRSSPSRSSPSRSVVSRFVSAARSYAAGARATVSRVQATRQAAGQRARGIISATAGNTRNRIAQVAAKAQQTRLAVAKRAQEQRNRAAEKAKARIQLIQKAKLDRQRKAALIAAQVAKAKQEQERIAKTEEAVENSIDRREETQEQEVINRAPPEEVEREELPEPEEIEPAEEAEVEFEETEVDFEEPEDLEGLGETAKEKAERRRKRAILLSARAKPKGTWIDQITGTATKLGMLGIGVWAGVSIIGKLIERRK